MIRCPFDDEELICVSRSVEMVPTQSWNVERYLVEEFVCPRCGLRVQGRWKIISLGR